MRRIGMLTSGGDCQALNATMRGVAKSLYNMFDDVEIIGFEDGYKGLMYADYQIMKPSDFSGILTEGGTILGTSRQPFKLMRVPDENGLDKVESMKHTYKKLKLSCLVVLVGPSVLIPRPETGQLVDESLKLLAAMGRPAKVLDLCTGSGCIAWSVALGAPGVSVTATDISEPALALARSQFKDVPSGANAPEFVCSDLLGGCREICGCFDLLLSNPPYVMEKEKAAMRRNVLDHEPGIALFVPDDDPLLFYRALASVSLRLLDSSGTGIVEINEALGPETAAVFETAGYKKTEILRDIFGKDRFVRFSSRV